MKRTRAVVVSAVVLLVCLVVLKKGALPLFPPEGTLKNADTGLIVAAVLAMSVNLTSRFARFHFLLAAIASVPFRRVLTINAIGSALVTFLPFRLGEVARPTMLREKGRLSAWAIAGAVAAERIVDGVAFCATLLAGLWLAKPLSPVPERIGNLPISAALVPRAALVCSVGFGCAFLLMFAFYRFRQTARALTERTLGFISPALGVRVANTVERLSDGLQFQENRKQALPFYAVTALSILAQVLATEWLATAVGLTELTFAQSMMVTGVVALGFAMPNAPGFFGTIQLAMYAGLASYVAPARVEHEGAAVVFLFYVIYIALIVFFGLWGLVAEYGSKRALDSAAATSANPH